MVDFRVGDKVWDARYGNGVISHIKEGDVEGYPISVVFDKSIFKKYTIDGEDYFHNENRSLFHGHDLTVNEVLPIRKKKVWVNLYKYKDGLEGYYYDSKEIADEVIFDNRVACVEIEIDE